MMVVRVYDSQSGVYFRSEVYAIINSGWYEKRLVVVPSDSGSYFQFFDYLDKSNPQEPKVLINAISSDGFHDGFEWLYRNNENVDEQLSDFTKVLDKSIRFFEYRGYSWIYDNKSLLSELLKGGMVSTANYENRMINSNAYKIDGWHYIETQQDIDSIFE
ncbi:MAG: hypothetical protein FWE28_02510 [Oscillospiraceae bacterium]|nr:hypothetical protein [Oscillospiraceae bacterium]